MEKFFGRTYETVGNVSGDLLLKTRGGVKIQIGSSFIDLIKNGKINVDIDIIKEASSKDNIIDNGFYLLDNILYVRYQDTILPINNNNNTLGDASNYVSYLPQLTTTQEQQIQAQKNIGIYYSTIEEAKLKINNGCVYVPNQGLYVINNQSESQVLTSDYFSSGILNLTTLKLGETQLQESQITLTDHLNIALNQQYLLRINNQYCEVKNTLLVTALKGYGDTFQLYTNSVGESYLKVDHIICSDSNLDYQANICWNQYYYSNFNNVITKVEVQNNIITLYLKYKITYTSGNILHVEFGNDIYDFTITGYNGTDNTVTVTLPNNSSDPTYINQQTICYYKPADQTLIGFSIQNHTITYGNNTNKTIIGKLPDNLDFKNGFYSDSIITKKQVLTEPKIDKPNILNATFKKSDNFPMLESGWELAKEDDSQNLATTKWVKLNKYKLPPATAAKLGGIMVGEGLEITEKGTLSVIDKWSKPLKELTTKVDTNTTNITNLTSRLDSLADDVSYNTSDISYWSGRINSLDNSLSSCWDSVTSLQGDVSSLWTAVQDLQNKVNSPIT